MRHTKKAPRRSERLSDPGRTRTPNTQIRSLVFYPLNYRAKDLQIYKNSGFVITFSAKLFGLNLKKYVILNKEPATI